MKENIIVQKTFEFAVEVAHLYKRLKLAHEYQIGNQLFRSAGSIGANVEEAQAALTKRDFIHKISIAAKEARETRYWLRLIQVSKLIEEDFAILMQKVNEIILILTSIIKTSQQTLPVKVKQ